jgi:hypothetical protein
MDYSFMKNLYINYNMLGRKNKCHNVPDQHIKRC